MNEANSISGAHTIIGGELFHDDKDEMVDTAILEGDLRECYHHFGNTLYKEKKKLNDAKILNNGSIRSGTSLTLEWLSVYTF